MGGLIVDEGPEGCACARARVIGVPIIVRQTPPDELGYYDPDGHRIVVRPGLPERVRRSTVAHELVHAERRDRHRKTWWGQHAKVDVEKDVEEIAARSLIDLAELTDHLVTGETIHDVARALRVDAAMVRARVATLTPAERRYIDRRIALEGEHGP